MPFLGTFANTLGVVLGSLIGGSLSGKIDESLKEEILKILGIITLGISFKMILEGDLAKGGATALLGYVLGRAIGISRILVKFEGLGKVVSASILFCTGPMTILGSIRDAYGDPSILLVKALLDGFASLTLASAYGYKIAMSSLVVLTVQGGVGLTSLILGGGEPDLSVLNSTGGFILISIAFNLMGLWKVETANFLTAFPLLIIWYFLPF